MLFNEYVMDIGNGLGRAVAICIAWCCFFMFSYFAYTWLARLHNFLLVYHDRSDFTSLAEGAPL
jgi:hypothetical protein